MDKKLHRARRANKPSSTRGVPRSNSNARKGIETHTCRRKPLNKQNNRENRRHDSDPVATLCFIRNSLMDILRDTRTLFSEYGNADYQRDICTTSRRLDSEGIRFATVTLPSFFDSLLLCLERKEQAFRPKGFKISKPKSVGITGPHFLRGLVKPILESPDSDKASKCIGLVYQFCVAFKKVQTESKVPIKQTREQLVDFVQTDIDLSQIDWSTDVTRDIAREAKSLITQVLHGLDPFDRNQASDFIPRPGPGATNTPTKHAERFRPSVWFDKLNEVFNIEEWFYPPRAPAHTQPRWGFNDHPCWPNVGRRKHRRTPSYTGSAAPPTARFKFVPKTAVKDRGICIEENEVQFLQQALRRGMVKRIEAHPLTKGYVNFTSQLVNGELALAASKTRQWATIDMSAASDRISRKLVFYLFGGNKQLLRALEAVSTDIIELPKVKGFKFIKYMPINKIAPMGSAICFPIMALVHYALIKAILKLSSLPAAVTRDVWVYGDDIVVSVDAVQAVYDYLPYFGMKFNAEKSFVKSLFRESCGIHAYNGMNVTPLRYKSVLHRSSAPCDLATFLRLEEAFFKKGYRHTCARLRTDISNVVKVRRKIRDIPFVHTSSPIFGFYRENSEASLSEFRQTHERMWLPSLGLLGPVGGKNRHLFAYSQTWIYPEVCTIVDSFDESVSFPDEEDRYLRYLVQGGKWGRSELYEEYSRNTRLVLNAVNESSLGFRC